MTPGLRPITTLAAVTAAAGLSEAGENSPFTQLEEGYDVDCQNEGEVWAPLRDVLGEDDGNDDSMQWAHRAGFRLDPDSPNEAWSDVEPSLKAVLPLARDASASSCLGVRVMGDVLAVLFERKHGLVRWGPVELLTASRFPIFRVLCAASVYDDLGMMFQMPVSQGFGGEAWGDQVAQLASVALQRQTVASQAAGWAMWFILGLMGLRAGTEHALAETQRILQNHTVAELLSSSFFCVLHTWKLWRLRVPVPRRRVWLPPAMLAAAGNPLYVTAAWGAASRSISRRVRQARELGLSTLIYCLDDEAFRLCESALGRCVLGHGSTDVHGAQYKYEVLLAVVESGRSAVWVDLDSHFVRNPRDVVASVGFEVGVVRHAHAVCANGGLLVLRPGGAAVVEQLINWLYKFPFGFEQNGLNALVRGVPQAPGLTARFRAPTILNPELFATVDGVSRDPVWLHWPTSIDYNFGDFLEEITEVGRLRAILPWLRREDREEYLLDCGLFHAALKAPMLVRFQVELTDDIETRGGLEGFLAREARAEVAWRIRVHTLIGRSYEHGQIVQKDLVQALAFYSRGAALGGREARDSLSRLNPTKRILGLL
eukprot:TRINITY_DN33830_c0_g1_i1.p1 TRINITY_DN33830_c0_g1~~TRINITY_DN33830_c0_g1_i1.p1  ORF type:complete len:598 (+),score=62.95 TRINITY_DN33830_c0_g1_i1:73-1866(+)